MSAPLSASFSSSLLSCAAASPTSRSAPAPRPAGRLRSDVDLHVGLGHQEGLRVGVHGDELDAGHAGLDHAADRVRPASADADHLDHGEVAARLVAHLSSHLKLKLSLNVRFPATLRYRGYGSFSLPVNASTLTLNLRLELRACYGPLGNADVEVERSVLHEREHAGRDSDFQEQVDRAAEPDLGPSA